jgi:hypothetical protein
MRRSCILSFLLLGLLSPPASAQEKPLVGLIPRAQKAIKLDGDLDEWEGAFVTPVHVGHPDFANRGGQFLFLWDEENLYIGQRCLDQKPAHVGSDKEIYNGDAVEFYLDTRRGAKLGEAQFTPGTLHMFWTPFTGSDVKPRMQVRGFATNPNFKLKGAEVAAKKTPWGYTAEFKLPWANFPNFTPKVGEILGIDCELCSSDGGPRVDRTFVYSSPASVGSPATFGRVKLVDKIDPAGLKGFGRALLPLSLTQSGNYPWLYGTVCVSPTIEKLVDRLEGKILDAKGAVKKSSTLTRKTLEGSGFVLGSASWELFDLPQGTYTVEVTGYDKGKNAITSHTLRILHGTPAPVAKGNQNPSPMVEHTRAHPQLKHEKPAGRREKLALGTLFLPEKLKLQGKVPLFIHFHGSDWLPEVAAAGEGQTAVISMHLGEGSATYARPFRDPEAFTRLLKEAQDKAGVQFGPIGLTAWSAGYGAVREILKVPAHREGIRFVVVIDGMHTGYVGGKPGPRESQLQTEYLEVFLQFARDAVAGKKQMIVTHSEIFPGTFASSTETADYLLKQLQLKRTATVKWGPMQMQQLSEVHKGDFLLVGYAGNSAPDHVDQLHALPEFLRWIRK